MPTKKTSHPVMTSAVVTLSLLELLQKKGISEKKIGEATGIDCSCMNDPEICIPYSQLLDLWRLAVEVTGNPALALHLRSEYGRNTIHFVGCIALNSANILEAAGHFCRYGRLICSAAVYDFRQEGDEVAIAYGLASPKHQNIWMPEHNLSLGLLYCRALTQRQLNPVEVSFQHPAPAYADEYRRVFGSRVWFDRAENAIVFKKEDLMHKISARNPHLQAVLIKQADASLEALTRDHTIRERVRRLMIKHLPRGPLNLETICGHLNMARSTLHRRLKQEGVSFSLLLDATRRDLARTYLERGMTISQISYLLGFAHPAAMQKAFKRWYNKSPGQFRKEMDIPKMKTE